MAANVLRELAVDAAAIRANVEEVVNAGSKRPSRRHRAPSCSAWAPSTGLRVARPDGLALRAILSGNLVVQVVSFAVVLRVLVRGLIPVSGASAALMHVVLGAAFAWQLLRLRRSR
jgi:hypothetical protein